MNRNREKINKSYSRSIMEFGRMFDFIHVFSRGGKLEDKKISLLTAFCNYAIRKKIFFRSISIGMISKHL
jgi:hypothetical protein